MDEIYDFDKYDEDSLLNHAYKQNSSARNNAVLVALELPRSRRWRTLESLEELKALANTAGLTVKRHFINKRDKASAAYFIGSGTLDKIKDYCSAYGVKTVIFDDELTPAQIKNISRFFKDSLRAMDRTELIIDIFAMRAQSKEGKLQIELARLEYMLPRLTRQWLHLVRQEGVTGGSVGVRGPGEKQLEMDRRQIRQKIHSIKKELKSVEKYRSVQRKRRKRQNIPVIAIVGYTNAGKSTLFNRMTDSRVMVRDKLFATLDPTARRFLLPNNQEALIIDTVGFIRKLPHELVDAFKATLEEVRQVDILIHVLDVSDEKACDRKKVVLGVLKELHAQNKTIITVLNKIDIMPNICALSRMEQDNSPAVAVSAKTGEGIDDLKKCIMDIFRTRRIRANLFIPIKNQDIISRIYQQANIFMRKDYAEGIYLEGEYDKTIERLVRQYRTTGSEWSCGDTD